MATTQQQLLTEAQPKRFIELIRGRLAGNPIKRPSEIAVACNVNVSTVYEWIDEGRIEGANLGRNQNKAYYQIFAPSVVRMYEERLGVTVESSGERCEVNGERVSNQKGKGKRR